MKKDLAFGGSSATALKCIYILRTSVGGSISYTERLIKCLFTAMGVLVGIAFILGISALY